MWALTFIFLYAITGEFLFSTAARSNETHFGIALQGTGTYYIPADIIRANAISLTLSVVSENCSFIKLSLIHIYCKIVAKKFDFPLTYILPSVL